MRDRGFGIIWRTGDQQDLTYIYWHITSGRGLPLPLVYVKINGFLRSQEGTGLGEMNINSTKNEEKNSKISDV